MKARIFQGFGWALVLASPIWLTAQRPPDYPIFALCVILGVLLLVLGHYSREPESRARK